MRTLEKREEMQWRVVRQEDVSETEGKCVHNNLWSDRLLYGADIWTTAKGQEVRLEVNELLMLRWMCGVTMRDKIRNEQIRATTRVTQASKISQKTAQVVRPCDEDEKGARSQNNVRCGHIREKKQRSFKPTRPESCL